MLTELFELSAKSGSIPDQEFDKQLEHFFTPEELERQNTDFDKYCVASLSKGEQVHPGKVALYKNFLLFLMEVQEEVGKEWRSSPSNKYAFRINAVTKLFTKSIRVAMESIPLIQIGAPNNLMILWRALYNDFVIAKFILQASESVAKAFNDFAENQYKKLNLHNETHKPELMTDPEERVERNDYAWAGLDKRNPNFSDIVKLLHETKFYQHYKVASMYHHSSSFSVNHPLFRSGGLTNINSLGFLPEALRYPFNLYIHVLTDFTHEIMLGFLPQEKREFLFRFILVYKDKLVIKEPGQKEKG